MTVGFVKMEMVGDLERWFQLSGGCEHLPGAGYVESRRHRIGGHEYRWLRGFAVERKRR